MSNVERSYNASRRMRKGSIEMLNSYGLKRPLRFVAKWLPTDEFITESPVIAGPGKQCYLLPYPKPTQVLR